MPTPPSESIGGKLVALNVDSELNKVIASNEKLDAFRASESFNELEKQDQEFVDNYLSVVKEYKESLIRLMDY